MSARHISKGDRKVIFKRDGYRCRYCGIKEGDRFDGQPLTEAQLAEVARLATRGGVSRGHFLGLSDIGFCVLTIDHIIPVSRGGSNQYANLVSACQPCNKRKDDMLPHEAGMKILGEPMSGHREGQQATIILVKGAEFFGEV